MFLPAFKASIFKLQERACVTELIWFQVEYCMVTALSAKERCAHKLSRPLSMTSLLISVPSDNVYVNYHEFLEPGYI